MKKKSQFTKCCEKPLFKLKEMKRKIVKFRKLPGSFIKNKKQ